MNTDTPETDKAAYDLEEVSYGDEIALEKVHTRFGVHADAEFARRLERERDEARAENQRLRKAIESILPGMKCQQPPKLGAWHWPHAVKTLEEALNPTKP